MYFNIYRQLLTRGQLNNIIYELKLNNYASNFNV